MKTSTRRSLTVQACVGHCLAPSSICILSGGSGGIAHVLEHLGPPIESWWRDLGDVTLNHELIGMITQGVTEELGSADVCDLANQRDDSLSALLQLKTADPLP